MLFGFLAGAFLFFGILWIGFEKIVERHIRHTVSHYDFRLIHLDKIRLSAPDLSINLYNIRLASKDTQKKVAADLIKLNVSWHSLFTQSFDAIDIKGFQYIGKAEDIEKSFLNLSHNKESLDEPKIPFHVLKIKGFINLDDHQKDYFIPLEMKFTHSPLCFGAHGSLRFISKNLTTDVKIHRGFDKENAPFHIHLKNFSANLDSAHVLAKELSLSLDEKDNNDIDITFNGDDISFALEKNNAPYHSLVKFETHTEVKKANASFDISGFGAIYFNHEKATLSLQTVKNVDLSSSLDLSIDSPKIPVYSLLKLFNDQKIQSIKNMSGEGSFSIFARFPFHFSLLSEKEKPWALDFLSYLKTLLTQKEKEGFAKINIYDTSFTDPLYSVEKLNTILNLKLFPLRAEVPQVIHAKSIHFSDLHLDQPQLTFKWEENLHAKQCIAKALGGDLTLHTFQNTQAPSFIFDIKSFELSNALTFIGIRDLSGSGKMDGFGQIEFSKEHGLSFKNAKFLSTSPFGKISYKGSEMLESDKNLDAMQKNYIAKMLENLTFKTLSFELSPSKNISKGILTLTGYNPEVMNGQPYTFKIETVTDFFKKELKNDTEKTGHKIMASPTGVEPVSSP